MSSFNFFKKGRMASIWLGSDLERLSFDFFRSLLLSIYFYVCNPWFEPLPSCQGHLGTGRAGGLWYASPLSNGVPSFAVVLAPSRFFSCGHLQTSWFRRHAVTHPPYLLRGPDLLYGSRTIAWKSQTSFFALPTPTWCSQTSQLTSISGQQLAFLFLPRIRSWRLHSC